MDVKELIESARCCDLKECDICPGKSRVSCRERVMGELARTVERFHAEKEKANRTPTSAPPQPTDPLTQEDLNKMFLETVWLQYPDGSGEPALVVNGEIYSVANLEGAGLDLEEYCQGESLDSRTGKYKVYRRPPEEGAGNEK